MNEPGGKSGRFSDFDSRLRKLLLSRYEDCPDLAIIAGYETVNAHIGVIAAHDYGGYQALLLRIFTDFKISYYGFSVPTIKKYATGSGKATKSEMVLAANNKWNAAFKDDNQVDSLHIASLVRNKFNTLS